MDNSDNEFVMLVGLVFISTAYGFMTTPSEGFMVFGIGLVGIGVLGTIANYFWSKHDKRTKD